MSLDEKLDKIRSQPKLQSQQQTALVLSAVEDTLRSQTPPSPTTPAAYFAALLSLLPAQLPQNGSIPNKEVAYAVIYLLLLVTPHVPAPLLRAKFTQILTSLAPAITHPDAEAPLLRAAIGVLESLLVVQNAEAWALPASGISPRRAVAGLLGIAVDSRPKVRKRASDAIVKVLQSPPPSPSLDHPAADMCAESALRTLRDTVEAAQGGRKKGGEGQEYQAQLIHALQLVKTIANASGGWPSKKIDALCELLLDISKSSTEYLTMAAFEVFEVIFGGMADEVSSAKLPRLLEVILELKPSQNDSQLLPPWVAVVSRGYDVAAQVEPEETFFKLPELFDMMAQFLSSPSNNIRVSASECLISFLANCIPQNVILEPSVFDEKILEKLGKAANALLAVKYQGAWMEVFNVVGAMFEALRWRSVPILAPVVKTIGDLRSNDAFNGKKEADAVLSKAIRAMGPEEVLKILPLNLQKPVAGQPGRAWLLPLLRDSISNTRLGHFREEMVPLSETMFQRVLDHQGEKTMELKIYETIVAQVWSTLPGYCDLPMDLPEAFDQTFAELLSNLLYQQTELRTDVCNALLNLVESNKAVAQSEDEEDMAAQFRLSKEQAQKNLAYLASFAANLLAVLFNVYSQTLPNFRGTILRCINAYLSITPEQEIMDTFTRVATMLESSLAEQAAQTQAAKQNKPKDKMPPTSHTLMDLIITLSIYLPRSSFSALFSMAAIIINKADDPQLQKKAYKLIPRLADSEQGRQAIEARSPELQKLLLDAAEKASAPSRRDRLAAITEIVPSLPPSDLSFIPCVLSEVVIAAKEVNEKARTAAFDLLVLMGEKMAAGGTVVSTNVSHLGPTVPNIQASLEEYFTMVSAGLAGTTPHMVSASITALARLLYQFHADLPEPVVVDLVQTMDLFLTSKNREIVRSVLGFVKVCVISLPSSMVKPRLETLIPNLMVWSHEHKAHFRVKVKHILERLVRKFGVEIVEKFCPEEDRKLITNIRKTRERRKRNKANKDDDENDEEDKATRQGKFESEFDRAVYSSDEEDSNDETEERELGAAKNKKKSQSYIVEDEDEPLDLLSRSALGNISSTKPLPRSKQQQTPQKKKAKVDMDGKLILKDSSDEEDGANGEEEVDIDMENTDLATGINAYVDAIRGASAARRGQKGKLKFKNTGGKKENEDDDEMDVDDEKDVGKKLKSLKEGSGNRGGFVPRGRGGFGGRGRGGFSGRGGGGFHGRGGGDFKSQRRGLGAEKVRGARVVKSPRGRGSFRGRRG